MSVAKVYLIRPGQKEGEASSHHRLSVGDQLNLGRFHHHPLIHLNVQSSGIYMHAAYRPSVSPEPLYVPFTGPPAQHIAVCPDVEQTTLKQTGLRVPNDGLPAMGVLFFGQEEKRGSLTIVYNPMGIPAGYSLLDLFAEES